MHTNKCFRSDGDWFCADGCRHDEEERQGEILAYYRGKVDLLPKCACGKLATREYDRSPTVVEPTSICDDCKPDSLRAEDLPWAVAVRKTV